MISSKKQRVLYAALFLAAIIFIWLAFHADSRMAAKSIIRSIVNAL